MPFGLCSAPRIFSKVLKPVISFLRSSGIKITSYLDDIFICSSSYVQTLNHLHITLDLLISLGFHVNWQKSVLTPTQKLDHLGYVWDSTNTSINLPSEKLSKIKSLVRICLLRPQTIRTYSKLLGLLVNSANAFFLAPLHYRKFQFSFIHALHSCYSWDSFWSLDSDALSDLFWWNSCTITQITPYIFAKPNLI